ncbi:MAG: copper amine oxidase N-terminal domain-containing protein, partial [Limnochordales bacterium]
MARGWRRCAPWLLGCLAVLLAAWPGSAAIQLVVDGRPISTSGALMLIGTGLGISAAVAAEELGIEVDDTGWPVVQLRAGPRTARLEAGQLSARLDGRTVQLQAAPTVRDGMLYLPLHLVADLAGLRVDWSLLAGVLTLERRPAAAGGPSGDGAGDGS